MAESTGKEGRGILPVADEPLGEPGVYGDDRVFVHLRHAEAPDEGNERALGVLAKAGHPVLTLAAHGPEDLGRIFFFAEFATAVAGWALGINPFDQPNVQEAKDATSRVLEAGGGDADACELEEVLDGAHPPAYVAIMAYAEPSEALDAAIADLRVAIRDHTGATTTFGYGPRFLHSTGQYHKGGPPHGRFVQLVHAEPDDVEIPGAEHSFEGLISAQAMGDLQALRAHGLPACQVPLEGDPADAVRRLIGEIA